ncbi:MAG: kynureninase [Acidimicrobiaceae bacterium]|nr:kynureninase [Acidimicrobiaceae bacterium]
MITRDDCRALDERDPLAELRGEFILAKEEIYLDGNSLGPVTRGTQRRVNQVIEHEWAEGLVRSWNAAQWMDAPLKLGDRLAPLIGAHAGEVLVADTLTFLLAKIIGGSLELRPERHVIITDAVNFHSDLYIVAGMARLVGREIVVKTIDRNTLDEHLDEDVALVMLTQVDFRTGEMLDMAGITRAVHEVGALMLWDFAHSTGAVPLDVTSADVDFAAGCGYKYLNGGPGAPAFMYVAPRWQGVLRNPLPGWLGHARPFDFESTYESAPGMRAYVTSSPSVIALGALDGALEVFERTTMAAIREKSLALTDLFIELVEESLPGVFELVTPREHDQRGSQVALRHSNGYGIIQALIERGVTGDFRAPDICRFGFAPLYLRYVDIYDAVQILVEVMSSSAYLDTKYERRLAVT